MISRMTSRSAGEPASLKSFLDALDGLPREDWEAHPGFGPLARAWLDRNRDLRASAPEVIAALDYQPRPPRSRFVVSNTFLVVTFVARSRGWNHIEEVRYFPRFAASAPRLAAAFEMLRDDHVTLDRALDGLRSGVDPDSADREDTAALRASAKAFLPLLERHLADETDLVLPVLLEYHPGAAD